MIRVLIADDDTDDIELFSMILDKVDLETSLEVVNDGVELIQRLSDDNAPAPHYVFLDLTMPKKSGFECLNHVRKNAAYDDVKVIILSDSVNVGQIDDAYDLGANHFITKPSDPEELREMLHYILNNSNNIPPSREMFVLRNHFFKKHHNNMHAGTHKQDRN